MPSKIAIATIVGQNQGNRLQNYALQTVLERMSGMRVETLRVGYIDAKKHFAKVMLYRLLPAKRWARFEEFDHLHINYASKFIEDKDLAASDYKLYFIGSDQVWNPTFPFTSDYEYLPQVTREKKVSYAASFGISEISENREHIGELLKGIPRISVREQAAKKIVKDLTGLDAILVLDPTMLLPIEDWRSIAKRPKMEIPEQGYILKYVLGENVPDEKAAKASGLTDWGIIDLKDKSLPVGPAEFVWLIDHAAFVCTDSFHASVFSILSHTPFAIFERISSDEDMSSRFDTLCELFELEGRRVRNLDQNEQLGVINWDSVDEKLAELREDSISFLQKALDAGDGRG